jgi:hypothetical protein
MASMGFNPFARHTENQPSKPNDQEKSASTPEPQTATASNAAETEERPPARPVAPFDDQSDSATPIPPSSAARTGNVVNPFAGHETKKQFRLVRKEEPLPAQRLLDWLRDWPHPVIRLRDFCKYGPGSLRDRKAALELAEVLVGHGWLVPIEARCIRRDSKWWRVVRGPNDYPTIAGVTVNTAITTSAATAAATAATVATNVGRQG